MNTLPTAHPSVEVLRAFILGQASFVPAETVAAHLATCPDCRKVVEGLSGDAFTDRVKNARSTVPLPTPDPQAATRDSAPDAPAVPPPDLPPELARHAEYEVRRKLGEGGMGAVYLARNKIMDRLEVLKVVNQSLLGRSGAAERFLQEIRSAAKLQHTNVVTAYSASRMGDLVVLAMEYVDGVDLANLVQQKGPLPIPHACHYTRQVALGLQQALEQGMVHRDIKPNNLILGRKSVVKILDFGLAKVRQEEGGDTGLTGTNVMMGTPDYMAPEQWLDARNADIRADIYSLGCTLYYLLTGRPPFLVKNSAEAVAAHTLKQPQPVNEVRPEVPAELAALMARMLAKNAGERPQTPADVARELAPFIKPGAKPAGAAAPPPLPLASPYAHTAGPRDTSPAAPRPKRVTPTVPEQPAKEILPPKRDSGEKPRPARPRTEKAKQPLGGGRKVGLWVAVAAAAAFGVFAALWLGGVLRIRTSEGVIVLKGLPADADVFVDGNKVTLKNLGDGETVEIQAMPGQRKLEVKRGGFKVFGRELSIISGGRETIDIRLEPLAIQSAPPANMEGFVSLFNGKDLTGWVVESGPANGWDVADGAIVALGRGTQTQGWLLTKKAFSDFILAFEFQAAEGTFGGVCFRAAFGESFLSPSGGPMPMHPAVAVGGIKAKTRKGPETTGLLFYNFNKRIEPVQAPSLGPPGTWNTMQVQVQGHELTASVNGVVLQRANLSEVAKRPDAMDGFDRSLGRVGFLQHTGEVRYRNIRIKELPLAKSAGAPEARVPADDKGFVPLFNGKDLTGWKTHPKQPGGWQAENGILIGRGNATSHLYTERGDYQNVHVRVEARINNGGNSGVLLRTEFGPAFPPQNPRFPLGYEAQIECTSEASPTGSLYVGHGGPGSGKPVVVVRDMIARPNEWFTMDVRAEGKHLLIQVNGKEVVNYVDERRCFTRGHIALQLHNPKTIIEFRKVEIKKLP